jgi:hypothetical protein
MSANQNEGPFSGTKHKIDNSRPLSSRSPKTPGHTTKFNARLENLQQKPIPVKTHEELYQDFLRTRNASVDRPHTVMSDEVQKQIKSIQNTKSHDSRLISAYRRYINQAYYRNTDYLNQPTTSGTVQKRFFAGLRTSPLHFHYSKSKTSEPSENQLKNLLVTNKATIGMRKKQQSLSKTKAKRIDEKLSQATKSFMNSSNRRKRKIVLSTSKSKRRLYPAGETAKLFTKKLLRKKPIKRAPVKTSPHSILKNSDFSKPISLLTSNRSEKSDHRLIRDLFSRSQNFSFEVEYPNSINSSMNRKKPEQNTKPSIQTDTDHSVVKKNYFEKQPSKMSLDLDATLATSFCDTTANSSKGKLEKSFQTLPNNSKTFMNNTCVSAEYPSDGLPSFITGFRDYSFGFSDKSTDNFDDMKRGTFRPEALARSRTSLSLKSQKKTNIRPNTSLNEKISPINSPKSPRKRPTSMNERRSKTIQQSDPKITFSKSKSPMKKENEKTPANKTPRKSGEKPVASEKSFVEFKKDGQKKVVTFSKLSKSQPDYTLLRNEKKNSNDEVLSKSYDEMEMKKPQEKTILKKPVISKLPNKASEKSLVKGKQNFKSDKSIKKSAISLNVESGETLAIISNKEQPNAEESLLENFHGPKSPTEREMADSGCVVPGESAKALQMESLNIDSKFCGESKARSDFGLFLNSIHTDQLVGCFGVCKQARNCSEECREYLKQVRTRWQDCRRKKMKNQIQPFQLRSNSNKNKQIKDVEAHGDHEHYIQCTSDREAVLKKPDSTLPVDIKNWLYSQKATMSAAIDRYAFFSVFLFELKIMSF